MEPLGEDEIFSIFERISNKEDKKSFALVCKTFFKVTCLPIVSFTCYKPFSNNDMKLIAESCPNIKHLLLYRKQSYDDPRDVRKLEFDDVGLCAIANACRHLVEVNLDGRLRFTEIGIGSLVRSCKNLRKLGLNGCVNVTDRSLKMVGEATRIDELLLYACHLITDLGLEYLANGDSKHCLETLNVGSCDRITDNGIVHLKKLVSLRNLCLSMCGANITDHGVVAICELPNLEELYLDFLTNITDISLLEIGRKCLKMWMLSLEGCEKITSLGLSSFSDHQELSHLFLSKCYKFSWEDVKSTVLTCPNLSVLSLSRGIKRPQPRVTYEEEFYITHDHFCEIYWI